MICDHRKVRGFYGIRRESYPNSKVKTYQFFVCESGIFCKVNGFLLKLQEDVWSFPAKIPKELIPFIPEPELLIEYKKQINKIYLF